MKFDQQVNASQFSKTQTMRLEANVLTQTNTHIIITIQRK